MPVHVSGDSDEELRDPRSPKSRRSEPMSGAVTLDAIRAMMEAQTQTLMRASQQQLDGALGKLENTLEGKIAGLDERVDRVIMASEQADERINKLEKQLAELAARPEPSGQRRDQGDRRQRTLVFGGWPRETRRQKILDQLKVAVDTLHITELMDEAPFTTGQEGAWLWPILRRGQVRPSLLCGLECIRSSGLSRIGGPDGGWEEALGFVQQVATGKSSWGTCFLGEEGYSAAG